MTLVFSAPAYPAPRRRSPGGPRGAPLLTSSWVGWWSRLLVTLAFVAPVFGQQEHPPKLEDESTTFSLKARNGPSGSRHEDDLERLRPLENRIARGEFQDVLADLRGYVRDHPDSPRGHYDLGYLFFRTHQVGDSIRELSRSLELNVNDAEAHKTLGLACTFVGRYDLAEAELQSAAKLDPNSAEIHYLLGRAYYTRGVYPLAQKEFETAIQLAPSYMKAYSNLGLVMDILGKNDEAVKNYDTAARLNNEQKLNSAWPYEFLSAYYNRQRQHDRAIEFAQKALSIDPEFDLAYFQIAKASQYQSKWKECAEAARKAIALNPRTADYYYVLSVALRRQGQGAESEAALKKFENLHEKEQAEAERWKKARLQPAQESSAKPRAEP